MVWRNKNILLTGASGFIGANLARHFLALGARMHLTLRPDSDTWRLTEVMPHCTLHFCDLCECAALRKTMIASQADIVIHAAVARGIDTAQVRLRTISTNVLSTHMLVETAAEMGVEKIILLGSSMEIGFRKQPLRESDALQPRLFFGATKAASTLLSLQFAGEHALPLTLLRLFSIYGYYEAPKRLIPTAIMAALEQQPVRLTRGGFFRDFTFIEDVVTACEKSILSPRTNGELLHIGSGVQHSNEEAVAMIGEISGRPVPVLDELFEPHQSDTGHWVCDTGKTRALLGWWPPVTLRQGVQKTIAWMQEHLDLYRRGASA